MECPLLDGIFCFQALTMFSVFDKAITNTVILRQYPTFMYWNIKSVQSGEAKKRRERQRERKRERNMGKGASRKSSDVNTLTHSGMRAVRIIMYRRREDICL